MTVAVSPQSLRLWCSRAQWLPRAPSAGSHHPRHGGQAAGVPTGRWARTGGSCLCLHRLRRGLRVPTTTWARTGGRNLCLHRLRRRLRMPTGRWARMAGSRFHQGRRQASPGSPRRSCRRLPRLRVRPEVLLGLSVLHAFGIGRLLVEPGCTAKLRAWVYAQALSQHVPA